MLGKEEKKEKKIMRYDYDVHLYKTFSFFSFSIRYIKHCIKVKIASI